MAVDVFIPHGTVGLLAETTSDLSVFTPAGNERVINWSVILTDYLLTLPTDEPTGTGHLWWNGGFLCKT